MERYFLNYKGIVIQNDDPKKMGRVKVYIPEVMTTLFKDWNNDKEKDKQITYLGANLKNPESSNLSPEILARLKKTLPWAEVKQPVFGQSSAGTYDASKDVFEISNTSNSPEQADGINKAVTGETVATDGSAQSTFSDTPTSEMTKTQDQLKEICSETNTVDINNYLNCNAAPPSVSTAKSGTEPPACGSASSGSPIEDFAYVANANTPNYFANVNPSNPSTPANSPTGTTPTGINPTTPPTTVLPVGNAPDNIVSVSFQYIPSTDYKSTKSTRNSLNSNADSARIISYKQALITVIPDNNTPALTAIAAHAAPIIYTLLRGGPSLSAVESYIPILFAPDNAYLPTNTSKIDTVANSIKIGAGAVAFDGDNFSMSINNTPVVIPKTSVTKININYSRPLDDIKLNSERLGDISKFFTEYRIPAESVFSSMVIPPASIPLSNPTSSGGSGGSSPVEQTAAELAQQAKDCSSGSIGTYNRGGGGSELFNRVATELLPINNVNNATICGACPESAASVNHKATVPKQNDPNKVQGNNIKNSKIDAKPPMISTTQNNKAKGIISIPGVGAHVSVYFEQGNPLYPIVDGIFYTQEDFKGIHDAELPSQQ